MGVIEDTGMSDRDKMETMIEVSGIHKKEKEMEMSDSNCIIWPEYQTIGSVNANVGGIIIENSPRAGGGYSISSRAVAVLQNIDESVKSRLTTFLIDQRNNGNECPLIGIDVIEKVKNTSPLPVYERAERILRFMIGHLPKLGDQLNVNEYEDKSLVLAWSESTESTELDRLFEYLIEMNWVSGNHGYFRMKAQGYHHVFDVQKNIDSNQAFVAMWFDESTEDCYENGIEPAVINAGYKPLRIDRKEHIGKIDDQIIMEIRRSKFLIADFTQGDEGARGGVYYEAGFAHGLGLKVIFTCHKKCSKDLHFDTSHYRHIIWETPEELKEKLKNCILANI